MSKTTATTAPVTVTAVTSVTTVATPTTDGGNVMNASNRKLSAPSSPSTPSSLSSRTGISFIIATVGRPSLVRTIKSIETLPGDEIMVVSDSAIGLRSWLPSQVPERKKELRFLDCKPGGDWGHSERNFAMPKARCSFLSFMDDDDYYSPGHRAVMEEAMAVNPDGPTIFSMRLHHMSGTVLWKDKVIRCGNVGTPMFFLPNDISNIGTWPPYYGGDCTFMETCKWEPEKTVWSKRIVAEVMGNSL